MACSRGAASPDAHTKLRLFADSGGYCQNPRCLQNLFLDTGTSSIHVGEMAHVFAASDDGPRADENLSPEERGQYDNLILLCPTCHTVIDKAPTDFPDALVLTWKGEHRGRIAEAFGVREYADREAARRAIEPALDENRAIFEQYGPGGDYSCDPESEIAELWVRKVLSRILPNNRRILAVLDANRSLLGPEERIVLERYRQHVDDMEARHLGCGVLAAGTTFPLEMARILEP